MKKLIVSILVVVLALWFITPWLLLYWTSFFNTTELKSLSEFGEQFSVINALFSGVALIFAVMAVLMQTKEMKLLVVENARLSDAAEVQIKHQKLLAGLQALISARDAKIQDISLHKTLYTKAVISRIELMTSSLSKENPSYNEVLYELEQLISNEKNKNSSGIKHLKKIDNEISNLLIKLEIDKYNICCHE